MCVCLPRVLGEPRACVAARLRGDAALSACVVAVTQEKNTNVGIAVTTALTYMHKYCWHLSEVVEDLPGGKRAACGG